MAGPMCWRANSTAVADESAERTHIDLGKDFVSESLSREAQLRELKKKKKMGVIWALFSACHFEDSLREDYEQT